MHFYKVLLQKSFLRQLQYRLAHMLNNAGSIIFGFIYIAIWQATLGEQRTVMGFGPQEMGYYLAFTQGMLFISTFLIRGLGIQDGIRTGAVSLELMRPMNFFTYHLFQSLGFQMYNFLFRSIPIFSVYVFVIGVYVPAWESGILLTISILLSVYIGFLLQYFVGIASFWTTDNRWAFMFNFTLTMTFSGNFVPLPLLPAPFSTISEFLPYASLHYYPALVYLERATLWCFVAPVFWAVVLTVAALVITRMARRKMEIQGG
jgi:ABC-2 type transport system permease protein